MSLPGLVEFTVTTHAHIQGAEFNETTCTGMISPGSSLSPTLQTPCLVWSQPATERHGRYSNELNV